jgi:hypothetical protein
MHLSKPTCVYCGIRPGITRDHVIPKCLFGGNTPAFMVVVPACKVCNETKKSKDDTYLRDMLVVDIHVSSQPIVQELLQGKLARAARAGQSPIAHTVRSKGRMEPLYTRSGIYLGTYPTIPIDGKRVIRIFSNIVRGLYFYIHNGKRIPDDYVFEVQRLDPLQPQAPREVFEAMNTEKVYSLGDGSVFCCAYLYGEEDPFVTYWLLQFYNNVFITVATNPPDDVQASK